MNATPATQATTDPTTTEQPDEQQAEPIRLLDQDDPQHDHLLDFSGRPGDMREGTIRHGDGGACRCAGEGETLGTIPLEVGVLLSAIGLPGTLVCSITVEAGRMVAGALGDDEAGPRLVVLVPPTQAELLRAAADGLDVLVPDMRREAEEIEKALADEAAGRMEDAQVDAALAGIGEDAAAAAPTHAGHCPGSDTTSGLTVKHPAGLCGEAPAAAPALAVVGQGGGCCKDKPQAEPDAAAV